MYHKINTIVFDLDDVLIDWNPEYLYSKLFEDTQELDYFLDKICTMDWSEEQAAGRPIREATEALIKKHPYYAHEIDAYYKRYDEMFGDPIIECIDLLEHLYQEQKYPLYALTNWSSETFPIVREHYPFLDYFKGVMVSGEEKLKKPDPKIYQRLLRRYGIDPLHTLFIDDCMKSIHIARSIGFHTIHFTEPEDLEEALKKLNILPMHYIQ